MTRRYSRIIAIKIRRFVFTTTQQINFLFFFHSPTLSTFYFSGFVTSLFSSNFHFFLAATLHHFGTMWKYPWICCFTLSLSLRICRYVFLFLLVFSGRGLLFILIASLVSFHLFIPLTFALPPRYCLHFKLPSTPVVSFSFSFVLDSSFVFCSSY